MAENPELEAFVKGGRAAVEQQAAEPKQDADATPTEPPPEPADAEPPAPREGEPIVPRRAFEDERHKRQSWVERAARAEALAEEHKTQAAALKAQLEELKRPQQQPAQLQQVQMPDPQYDPHGFARAFAAQTEQRLLNDRLNMSELMLREKIGPEKVQEYVAEFKQLAADDPSLSQKLYSQPHPYGWLQEHVDQVRLRIERSAPDYEAKMRAKWEAERAAEAPPVPVSPAVGMAPSLATARSVAGRSSVAWTGPRPLDQILRR